MGRRPKEPKPPWRAPRDPEERAKLRAKLEKKWPHPADTFVTYWPIRRRYGFFGTPLLTRTRSVAFYDRDGKVAVFVVGKADSVPCSHLELRDRGDVS